MAQNVTIVQPGHGYLGDDHLQESRECRKDAELVRCKTESGSSRIVATLHDSGRNEDFGMLLMNDFQTGGTFKVT